MLYIAYLLSQYSACFSLYINVIRKLAHIAEKQLKNFYFLDESRYFGLYSLPISLRILRAYRSIFCII